MIGEIGGSDETNAGKWAQENMSKPVVAFIAGKTAPIIGGEDDTASAKMDSLRSNGIIVSDSPADIGLSMAEALGICTLSQ